MGSAADDGVVIVTGAAETTGMRSLIYNSPAEVWEARRLKEGVEEFIGVQVELGADTGHGGPICDGRCFAQEFGFKLRGLRDDLSAIPRHD
jgi:hypothetical protein